MLTFIQLKIASLQRSAHARFRKAFVLIDRDGGMPVPRVARLRTNAWHEWCKLTPLRNQVFTLEAE